MIRPLISTYLLARTTPFLRQTFSFCSSGEGLQNEDRKGKDLDRSQNFYRNSIRKININDKGRGKFTEHHLIRLTKLTQKPSQLPLLFEGYYNYLGHLTPISSRTVDRMLSKALSFEGEAHDSVLEVFQNHNYLSYFPSYEVTNALINSTEQDEANLIKLMLVFMHSPLIKFNQQIVDKLLQVMKNDSSSHGVLSSVIKVLMQRSALHLIDDHISPSDLLLQIGQSIENRFKQGKGINLRQNVYVSEFFEMVEKIPEKSGSYNANMTLLALAFSKSQTFYANLVEIEDINRVQSTLQYLNLLHPKHFGQMTSFIESQEPNDHIRGILESLKPAEAQGQAELEAEEAAEEVEAEKGG